MEGVLRHYSCYEPSHDHLDTSFGCEETMKIGETLLDLVEPVRPIVDAFDPGF